MPEAVRTVLSRGAFDGLVFRLPPEQLDRKLYVEVNEVLEAAGGKWSRKQRGHVFSAADVSRLNEILQSGVVPPKNPDAFFPTPPAVADEVVALAGVADPGVMRVLEPSAGTGALALAASRVAPRFCVIHCVEIDERRARVLSDAGSLYVWNADFLEWDEGESEYHRIVMNPPFALDGDATAWITHVDRALTLLAPKGRLVAVVPSAYKFRTDRKHTAFRDSLDGRSAYHALPEDAFRESGTGVNTGLLVVEGLAV